METLGMRIRAARKRQGMSQEDAALEAGFSRQAWSLLETGGVDDPHISVLAKVASALQVSLSFLIPQEAGQDGSTLQQGSGQAGSGQGGIRHG